MTVGRPGALLAARYRLDRLVGSTGSSELWQAYDERLARPVTAQLTSIAGDAAHEEAAQAALERLAGLNHPGVAAVYDVGTVDDLSTLGAADDLGALAAVTYAISEWTQGRTLSQIMGTGPQPWPRVADWGQQIGAALAALHSLGIVHGALGPNSIAIHDDRQVKILDAGLGPAADAAAIDAEAPQDLVAGDEASGEAEGRQEADDASAEGQTAEQVAESVEGEGRVGVPVGAAQDVYALGLLLWEAAVGAAPALVERESAADLEMLRRVDAPTELAALLGEMLDADPARRPTAAVARQRFGPFVPSERDTLPEIEVGAATTAAGAGAAGTATAFAAADTRTRANVPTPRVGRTQGAGAGTGAGQHGGSPPKAAAAVGRLAAERERRRRRGLLVGLALLLAALGAGGGLLIANLGPSNAAQPGGGNVSVPSVSPGTVTLPSASPSPSASSAPASVAPPASHKPSSSPSPSSASPSPSASLSPSSATTGSASASASATGPTSSAVATASAAASSSAPPQASGSPAAR